MGGKSIFKNIVGVYEEIYGKVESYYLLRNGRKIAHGKVFFNQDSLPCESENTIKFYDWKKKKAGFLDSQGREIIPAIYDEVSIFRNGVAWALKGATLIQKKIDSHCTLSRWSGGIQVLIDKKNTVLIKNFKYDNYLDWYSLKIREKPSGFENVKSFLGKNGKYYEFYSYELEFKQWLNNEFFKKLNPKTISSYYVKDEKQIDEDVKIMILKSIHEFKNLLKEKGRYFIQKSLDSFPVRKEFAFENKSYENCGSDSWTRYNVFVLVIEHDNNHSYFQNQFEF